jgi:hypothetical protein
MGPGPTTKQTQQLAPGLMPTPFEPGANEQGPTREALGHMAVRPYDQERANEGGCARSSNKLY